MQLARARLRQWCRVGGGFYSLIFLPLTPLALLGLVFGIGPLPLAPAAAFISAIVMRARLRRRGPRPRLDHALWDGFAAGLSQQLSSNF